MKVAASLKTGLRSIARRALPKALFPEAKDDNVVAARPLAEALDAEVFCVCPWRHHLKCLAVLSCPPFLADCLTILVNELAAALHCSYVSDLTAGVPTGACSLSC